jgi:two-component system, response regulator, stage 0 sporulation protein F
MESGVQRGGGMKHILIIEDDAFTANILRARMQREGYGVTVTASGEEGLAHLEREPTDLLLLDLQLPGLNGVQVLERLRPRYPQLPVVVLTNCYRSDLVEAARLAGASEVQHKGTCAPKELIDIVQRNLLRATEDTASAPITFDPLSPADIQAQMVDRTAGWLDRMRAGGLQIATGDQPGGVRQGLGVLQKVLQEIAAAAAMTGRAALARLACAFDAFCAHLADHALPLNTAHLHTLDGALDAVERWLRAPAPPSAGAPGTPPLALVVDDDATARRLARAALERFGLPVVAASDPRTALTVCGENEFKLLVFDVDMPGMNGFELYEQVARLPAYGKTPVIFITALDRFDRLIQTGLREGQALMAKPFPPVELGLKACIQLEPN